MLNPDIILGIDPGSNITGYGIVERKGAECRFICAGVFDMRTEENHQLKLKEIFLRLQELVEVYLPKHMAIEAPFFGKNVQSMLKLGRAQGVAMAAAMTMGLEIHEYSPKKIKLAITGNGNASKEQVAFMIEQRLKQKLSSSFLDASDALAVALCHTQNANANGNFPDSGKFKSWESFIKANPDKLSNRKKG